MYTWHFILKNSKLARAAQQQTQQADDQEAERAHAQIKLQATEKETNYLSVQIVSRQFKSLNLAF